MKRFVSLLIILIAALALSSCAGNSAPIVQPIIDTAARVCSIYEDARPDVIAVRPVIAAGFDQYPANVQKALRTIDGYLPELDAIGAAACAFATTGGAPPAGMTWDRALAILKEVAPLFVDLRARGVIG